MSSSVFHLFFENDAVSANNSAPSRTYYRWKARLDFAMAVVLLILTCPVILLAMVLVKLTSRGPAIYMQQRLGQAGRTFTIYKIRTMYQHSERDTGAVWSRPGDPRVTPVGWILRAAHVDELPQLVNILRCEMSLIGPRPERPEITAQLERVLPGYRKRLNVRPGVSGLAQVQLPPDSDIAGVALKLSYDLYYVWNLSLWLDLRITVATLFKVLMVPFAAIRWLLWFPACPRQGDSLGVCNPRSRITAESFS
jgi:lipopolysaccharide/colanic/teichoic acid biosynthesis glycosyltransferase